MTTNEIVQQTEQLFHSEYENDNIDETILVAMTNEHRTFCLTIENFLIQFVNSSKMKDILTDLDKFKRKIVHKIAERFGVIRDYVNVKSNDLGDITLIKSDKTHIPIPSLTEIMKRRDAEKEKTSIDHSKVIKKIYQRNPNNPSNSDAQNKKKSDNSAANSKEEEFEIQKRNEKYDEAKKRILIGKNINPSKTNDSYNEKSKVNKLESRQANNINYDPDYNRNLNRPPPQQNYQQPIISNPILVPNQTNFNNNFNYPPANNNPYFMKFSTPPGYQNYNQNMNLMNELNFQNQNINFSAQNTKQPNLNILFNQFGYNNYGGHLNPQNNNSMNIGLVQQQPNITQQMYNKNFQDNRVNNNDVNGCVENLNFRTNNINPPFENNQFIVEENKKKQVPKENKANIGKIFNAENFPTLDEANNKN